MKKVIRIIFTLGLISLISGCTKKPVLIVPSTKSLQDVKERHARAVIAKRNFAIEHPNHEHFVEDGVEYFYCLEEGCGKWMTVIYDTVDSGYPYTPCTTEGDSKRICVQDVVVPTIVETFDEAEEE